jgi:hypothetical protein
MAHKLFRVLLEQLYGMELYGILQEMPTIEQAELIEKQPMNQLQVILFHKMMIISSFQFNQEKLGSLIYQL